jgi:hypothetical protein
LEVFLLARGGAQWIVAAILRSRGLDFARWGTLAMVVIVCGEGQCAQASAVRGDSFVALAAKVVLHRLYSSRLAMARGGDAAHQRCTCAQVLC